MDPSKLIQTCLAHKPPGLSAQALRWIFSLIIASDTSPIPSTGCVGSLGKSGGAGMKQKSGRVREEESRFRKESSHLWEGKERRAEERKEITSFWNVLVFFSSPLPFIPNTTCGAHTRITSFFFIVQWHHWVNFCAIIMGPPTNHLALWLKSETPAPHQRDNHLQKRKLFLLLGAVKNINPSDSRKEYFSPVPQFTSFTSLISIPVSLEGIRVLLTLSCPGTRYSYSDLCCKYFQV